MATNKERIENLRARIEGLQNSFNRIEEGIGGRMQKMEETINKLFDIILSKKGFNSSDPKLSPLKGRSCDIDDEVLDNLNGEKPMFAPEPPKLEFTRIFGDDPTVWHMRAEQHFDFQATLN
ncbi:hypothetical protein PTKIN_Ptkin18bG0015600 [Pterospermum kingtungense]